MNIAILGFGSQGKSAYDYWHKNAQITVCDQNEINDLPAGVQLQSGDEYLHNLDRFDLIVRSPSIHPRDILANNSEEILAKVTTNTNEFMKVCPSRNIIGVTGTKGKGTTSTLISKILEAAGKQVHLGGNIGTPPLELLKEDIQPDVWIVLELANFQLIDFKQSPTIAVCLMIVPEHLNWHANMAEYVDAKRQLFVHQSDQDKAIYYSGNDISKDLADSSPGVKIPYFAEPGAVVHDGYVVIAGQRICHVNELKLLGQHNWQNVCAAVTAAWQIIQDVGAIRAAVTSFSGLPHRLEFVRELNGVKYYDDSFGTTPETAIVALQAFSEPKVMILGGSDKGSDFSELARTVKNSNTRTAILIGDTAPKIQAALEHEDFYAVITGKSSMQDIVSAAQEAAKPGDVVLLSTGCASFGLFNDYKDRGEQFNRAVQELV